MKLDLFEGFSLDLHDVPALVEDVRKVGFSGIWFPEAAHNPFLSIAAAALTSEELTLGTAIAVAFPRSPMVMAQIAWDLAKTTRGNFALGLGSQVKGQIERRFSVPYSRPVPRLREYVLALRAIFRAFQGEERLMFDGEFYQFSLLTPFFSPGPIDHPRVPIFLGGANSLTARLAGELCDGFHVHPLHSRRYLDEVICAAVTKGAETAGRSATEIDVAVPVLTIVGDSEEEIVGQREEVRARIAFYGSTRTYRPVFEMHGWGDTNAELHALQAEGKTGQMAACITDDMVDTIALTATWSDLADALIARYQGLASRVYPYSIPRNWRTDPEISERWKSVAATVNAS